jgi:hypothetical protein
MLGKLSPLRAAGDSKIKGFSRRAMQEQAMELIQAKGRRDASTAGRRSDVEKSCTTVAVQTVMTALCIWGCERAITRSSGFARRATPA